MNITKFEETFSLSEQYVSSLESISQVDVRNYLPELKENLQHFNLGGKELLKETETLRIGVVGQMKVGKSSFLNSLFFNGENILPKAATPMTAGLTILQYTEDRSRFEVEYFSQDEWDIFENDDRFYKQIELDVREEFAKEPNANVIISQKIKERTTDAQRSSHEIVLKCRAHNKIGKKPEIVNFDGIGELQNILEKYVGANGKFTSVVKSLNIYLNDERLKGVQIVDTPGVNDPIISREMRTREFLQACHGVFFLSFSSRFFDSTDASFIDERIGKQGVGVILMLACKFDSVLQNLGMKYKGKENSLEHAIDEAKEKLKTEFETKRAMLESEDLQFAFDTSSGIGFAIAQKSPDKWDDVEAHVVKQMKNFYPEYFTTDEDIRDNFLDLANFDSIKEEYLQKLFIENKKEIISHKIDQFFELNKGGIIELIDHILEILKSKKKQLETSSLAELTKQRKEVNKLFGSLKKKAEGDNGFYGKFGNNLQLDLRALKENELSKKEYTPDLSMNFPTVQENINVRHKSFMFFHSTSNFEVSKIDRFKLRNLTLPALERFRDLLRKEWDNIFKKRKQEMFDWFCEEIKSFSNSTGLDETAYRDIMDKFLSDMDKYRTLEGLNDILGCNKNLIANYIDENEHTTFIQDYDCKKSEVQDKVNDEATEKIINMRTRLGIMINDANQSLYNVADSNVKKIVNVEIPHVKADMIDNLNKMSDDYFRQLEDEISKKETTLMNIEKASDILKELKKLYK